MFKYEPFGVLTMIERSKVKQKNGDGLNLACKNVRICVLIQRPEPQPQTWGSTSLL